MPTAETTAKSIDRTGIPIGRGRSACVFRLDGPPPVARKVFIGSRVADVILSLFYGAPNEYRWCEPAIKAAFFRRRVLARLVRYWFGERLRVANAIAWGQDTERAAQYLDTEFVNGKPPRMYSPFLYGIETETRDLQDYILPKLQQHLIEAGFVGTVWQAGKGQPCALPNFLCTRHDDEDPRQHRWAWIDLESGVPAIASYNPFALFGFYIPEAWKRGRVLFDDLDGDELQAYLARHEAELKRLLGPKEHESLVKDAASLVTAHSAWSKEDRLSRSLKYFLFRGRITEQEYYFYEWSAWRWYGRLASFFLRTLPPRIWRKVRERFPAILRLINPVRWARFFFNLVLARSFRTEISRQFARRGIREWQAAGRISAEQAQVLESELEEKDASPYLADFGVHLALKPLGYILRVTLIPFLAIHGLISPHAAVVLLVFIGMILRVLYTVVRTVEDVVAKKPFPLTALVITPIPSLGTLAYPCQMIHSARSGHLISQFIIYESCSTIAEHIPIWGGRDTGWDHFFNRLAHAMIRISD